MYSVMGPESRTSVSPRTIWTILLNALALGAVLLLVWRLRTVISWGLIALLIALATQPAVQRMRRYGLPRGLAVLVVFLVVGAALAVLLITLVPMLIQQGQALITRAPDLVEHLRHAAPVEWADQRFHVIDRLQAAVREAGEHVAASALALAASVFQGVLATVSIVALTVFMLIFGEEVFAQMLAWLPPQRRTHWLKLANRMRHAVGGYVAGVLLVATIGGVVMGTVLASLGVPYFVPLGMILIVLGIVPYIGSLIGVVLLVTLTLVSAGLRAGIIVLIAHLVYQQIENHVLQPMVQRRAIRMNPLYVTLAMLAGTSLAGIIGALLALPVAGALQVLLQDALRQRLARFSAPRRLGEPVAVTSTAEQFAAGPQADSGPDQRPPA